MAKEMHFDTCFVYDKLIRLFNDVIEWVKTQKLPQNVRKIYTVRHFKQTSTCKNVKQTCGNKLRTCIGFHVVVLVETLVFLGGGADVFATSSQYLQPTSLFAIRVLPTFLGQCSVQVNNNAAWWRSPYCRPSVNSRRLYIRTSVSHRTSLSHPRTRNIKSYKVWERYQNIRI